MFHVPEQYRIHNGPLGSDRNSGNNGAFSIPPIFVNRRFYVIASDGQEWEHVSVHMADAINSRKQWTPNWEEMDYIKNLFWDKEDCVMQLHPPHSMWVNNHPHTLHLWRTINQDILLPHPLLVGMKDNERKVRQE